MISAKIEIYLRPNRRYSMKREQKIYRVTILGSIVNVLLLIFKFTAGVLGHSAAMIADAVHSLSDFLTDLVVLAFVRISTKPADADHDYGHGKYETLATTAIGLALLGVGVMIGWDGIDKIFRVLKGESLDTPGWIALAAALVSILMKAVGIALVAELSATICADAGNASLGKMLQILGGAAVLTLSVPMFRTLMTIIKEMIGGL